jgi:hypothetical protein
MRVLVDIDGVVAEFCGSFTKVAAELGLIRTPHCTAEQTAWKFDFHVDKVWDEIDARMNWWMTLEPLVSEDEIALLNRAIRQHEIFFVTNRRNGRGLSVEQQTRLWLESIGVDVEYNGGAARVIAVPGSKAEVTARLGIELALDDKLDNLNELAAAHVYSVARRWAYNTSWPTYVSSLGKFLEQITVPDTETSA